MTLTNVQALEILSWLGMKETPLPLVSPIQGGFDALLWKVEYQGQTYGLRVFQPGKHEDCEREQVVLTLARAAGLPVPEVHKTAIWQDRAVLLMSWLTGHTIAEELRTHPWNLWHLGILFGRMQMALHATPLPDTGLHSSESWITWKSEGEEDLQDRLRHISSKEAALLHLDYHPLNILTNGKQITGILDWTNVHIGDPRADIARTLSILRFDPTARKPFLQLLALRVFELAWRTGYQWKRGHPKDMAIFHAWAGTVILHDLAHRYTPQELSPAHRWTRKWKARAGC